MPLSEQQIFIYGLDPELLPEGTKSVPGSNGGLRNTKALYKRFAPTGCRVVVVNIYETRDQNARTRRGIRSQMFYADCFSFGELKDAVRGRWPIVERRTRWNEATESIVVFRRLVLDATLSIVPECRALAVVSVLQAFVRSDDQSGVRLLKRRMAARTMT